MSEESFDVVIVGGGIAGLTAGAYTSRAGRSTLLLEKESYCGGLVNSFVRDGFHYDGGIRATENAGVLFPMLRDLGIELDFVKNHISLGISDRVVRLESEDSLVEYQDMLNHFFPENRPEIEEIVAEMKKAMRYMEVQYSIENPAFLDVRRDRDYFIKKILPWMARYALTVPKINKLNEPIEDFLRRLTKDQAMVDVIAQHFFDETPAFFALSYLKIYLDYHYPKGGTSRIPDALKDYMLEQKGVIRNNVEVTAVDPREKQVVDGEGNIYAYEQLIWAADQKRLYSSLDIDAIQDEGARKKVLQRKEMIADKRGNDTVFTVFLAADLDKSYFKKIASEHFFYTPQTKGESGAGPLPLGKDWEEIKEWIQNYFALSTFEIACPVLRDESLAPPGKAGLIISLLFDYHLAKHIADIGHYEELKTLGAELVVQILNDSIFPGLQDAVIHKFSSTPLTLERYTSNTHGAIVGWSFTNQPMPAEYRLPKIFSATETPIPDVSQAGQWTYSPAGFPISILTGKLAADRALKALG